MSKYKILLRKCKKKKKPKFTLRWFINPQSFIEGLMARITTEQQVPVTVAPMTPGGHPAKIKGDVTFTSSDATVATVTSTGQFGAMVVAVGVGAAQITASFETELQPDEPVNVVTLSGAIEVVDAEASTGVLTFGTPELIPAAPATPPAAPAA